VHLIPNIFVKEPSQNFLSSADTVRLKKVLRKIDTDGIIERKRDSWRRRTFRTNENNHVHFNLNAMCYEKYHAYCLDGEMLGRLRD